MQACGLGSGVSSPESGATAYSDTFAAFTSATYALAPSLEMSIDTGDAMWSSCLQFAIPMPVRQAAAPAGWVSTPPASRSSVTIDPSLLDVAYTCVPSGLTAIAAAPSKPRPPMHPSAVVLLMQPAAPGGWVSLPPASASRARTTTESLVCAVT